MTLYTWSTSAAANGSIDATVGVAEGMAPSALNDAMRAVMAAIAKYRNDQAGALLTTTSSVAYAASTGQVFDTLAHLSGNRLKVRFHATNGASPTLNVDGLGAKPIQVDSATAVTTGFLKANSIWDVTYDSTAAAFILSGVPAIVQAGTVTSTSLASGAVTYAKIQNETNSTLLGNFSGGAAAPSEYTPVGAVVSGTNITFPQPPPSAFKNLVIKVASNTTVTVTADYVTVFDGTNSQTLAFNSTVNLGTTGADALDTGTIAADSEYHIWCIAKSDGTAKCLASLSSSSPTMPSGYTFKARVGCVKTIHASATLYGTYQYGRESRFVVGLAQTSNPPLIASGSTGNINTPTWTSVSLASLVPTTASEVICILSGPNPGATVTMVAPSSNYGAYGDSTKPPPLMTQSGPSQTGPNMTGKLLMETSGIIYWAGTNSLTTIRCYGWTDNI